MALSPSLNEHFGALPDPRLNRTKRHKLIDILVLAICAMVCGAEDFVAMARFGRLKEEWFRERLELPNGIPSHDTFNRVFGLIDPKAFRECFLTWIEAFRQTLGTPDAEHYVLDGKTSRHTYSHAGAGDALHLVSVWARKAGLVVGEQSVDEKSNEITAVPALLHLLDLKGCLVSMDAMHCQKENTRIIVEAGGDYVLGLKGNQAGLQQAVEEFFEGSEQADLPEFTYHRYQQLDKEHGRIETRLYTLVDLRPQDMRWLDPKGEWTGLNGIGMVESRRQIGPKKTHETRYFISSIRGSARRFAQATRGHWAIENSLHWVLDIAFREDECRVHAHHAPENLAILRHIALNLLRQDNTAKCGIRNRRLSAGWDNRYLSQILAV